jgi:redox-sensitive bicupin YhaK (pirin superfamily)
MDSRDVVEILRARPASDGDGVRLLRVFGGSGSAHFDPFLLLDEFGSDQPQDYQGGFPPHPHRGFETVTYMLHGKMEHRDHLGNVGLLSDGGVQWMTAGRGIVHSEMPKQTQGLMQGFQLWVNLPASEKMKTASYSDIAADQIPVYPFAKASIKLIAGEISVNREVYKGFFDIADTRVIYGDIRLEPESSLVVDLDSNFNALAYVFAGSPCLGKTATRVEAKSLARLGRGDSITISNPNQQPAALLLIAGLPLKEPVVQYGPFVMNTRDEIELAIREYQAGTLTD